MASTKNTRLTLLGERVGAPFSAWRINPDYTVTGVTLYVCNDRLPHFTAKQAYTARGTRVFPDTSLGKYFTNQNHALEMAYNRADKGSRAAHEAYVAAQEVYFIASRDALNARDALNKNKVEQ
jgi:hypothetical protein